MTSDGILEPLDWAALDALLPRLIPRDQDREEVESAVLDLVRQAEAEAAKEAGGQLLDIITGENFLEFRRVRGVAQLKARSPELFE